MLAWGESFACLLAYLLTPSAHHLSQPLHLSKSAPSIYLTTHLSIYLSIHLPALITPHRLLFSFRTVLPFSAFIFFSSYPPLHLLWFFFFLTPQIYLLCMFSFAKLANLEKRVWLALVLSSRSSNSSAKWSALKSTLFPEVWLKIELSAWLITNQPVDQSEFTEGCKGIGPSCGTRSSAK